MSDLRYPIGKFVFPDVRTHATRTNWIETLQQQPAQLSAAVAGLNDAQLDTPYRPGGWRVRQVVHHVVDSHLNSYVRFKLALTEDKPVIKPYNEAAWATLADSNTPVQGSLDLLELLHERWVVLLLSLPEDAWARVFVHPESNQEVSLERNLALYAWHGLHHIAHITSLRVRENW